MVASTDRLAWPPALLAGQATLANEGEDPKDMAVSDEAQLRRTQDLQQAFLDPANKKVPAPARLKQLVRGGIAHEHRPVVWFSLSGAKSLRDSAPADYYTSLCNNTSSVPSDLQITIDDDVRATYSAMRQHKLFQSSKGIEALSRLLLAYAQRNPAGGYCRGMNVLAGLLLVVFGVGKEEEAFWTLVALLEVKLFPYCGGQLHYGLRVEQKVLSLLAAKKMPKLSAHLTSLKSDTSVLTSGWFNTLFFSVLPPEMVLRVWDCIMYEGSKVMHRVGLALLRMYEKTALASYNVDSMKKVLDWRVKRTSDTEQLLRQTFHGIGSFPGTMVAAARDAAAKAVEDQMQHYHNMMVSMISSTLQQV